MDQDRSLQHVRFASFRAQTTPAEPSSSPIEFVSSEARVQFRSARYAATPPDITFRVYPDELTVRDFTAIESESPLDWQCEFVLTPNALLWPEVLLEFSEDRRMRVRRGRRKKLTTASCEIEFNVREATTRRKPREHLIAVTKATHLSEELSHEIDDVLLIASFGSRSRTICATWMATNGLQTLRQFRCNVVVPTQVKKYLDESLVPAHHFEAFMGTAVERLPQICSQASLRVAIYSLVPGSGRILEDAFLSLFASLERLVLFIRRESGLDYVVGPEQWNSLQRTIKNGIKPILVANGLDEEQRKNVYMKLGELNRVPLETGFRKLVDDLSVSLEDLWPVFDKSPGVSLYEVRNCLAHGITFPKETWDGLILAHEHLKLVLERMLLELLGWPVRLSVASHDALACRAPLILEFQSERDTLTKILRAQQDIP